MRLIMWPKAPWLAKFKGQFDQGWDKYREEAHAAGSSSWGSSPPGTKLTPRPFGKFPRLGFALSPEKSWSPPG